MHPGPAAEKADGAASAARLAGFGWVWYLVPPCAGVALGLAVYATLSEPATLLSVWPGAQFDVETLPPGWVFKAPAFLFIIGLWALLAALLEGERAYAESLRRTAPAFSAFLSILVLNMFQAYTGADVMYWSVLATIYSFGFLAAYSIVLSLSPRLAPLAADSAPRGRRAAAITAFAAVAYFAVSASMSLLQYRAVRISYHDTAGFDEMLWRTIHGQFLRVSCFEHSFLGQHFEFIQLFLLPVYVLWPGLQVMMLVQSAVLASGVVPVYLLAKRKLNSPTVAALFSAAYLLYAPMQYTEKRIIYETYLPENMAIVFLLWAIYFFDGGRMWRLLVAGFLAAACKEDMVLPIAMMGLVLLVRGKIKWGTAFFLGGSLWFILSLTVVIPYFEEGQSHVFSYFGDWGGSAGEIARSIAARPGEAVRFFFEFQRVDFLLMMLVPMGMLALLSPTLVFIFLPSIATNNLAAWAPSATIFYHYHISLVPFAVGGAVFGAANVVRLLPRAQMLWGRVAPEARPRLAAVFCGVLVLASAALGDVAYGKFPWSLRFYNSRSSAYWRHIYVASDRAKFFVSTVLPKIPKDARVSASQYLATRFTHQPAVYVFPRDLEKSDYVVIEKDEPDNPSHIYTVSPVLEEPLLPGFELVFDEGGILIFKRNAARPLASAETR